MVWYLFLLLAVTLLVLFGLLFWFLSRRRKFILLRRRQRARAIHPVVLAHGILGFDEMRIAGTRIEYFRGVANALSRFGIQVYCPKVPPASTISVRAQHLAKFIQELDTKKVNIIAHSMGGLDARYALSCLNLAEHVCSLTTIGTPHRGSPLADLGAEILDKKFGLKTLLALFNVDSSVFYDFKLEKMAEFNQRVTNLKEVFYSSIVGVTEDSSKVNGLLLPSYLFLKQHIGANDGLVPRDSQKWGEVIAEVEADHWGQVGWSKYFDACAFYEELVRELSGRGC